MIMQPVHEGGAVGGRKIRLLFISSINVRWMHLEWIAQELDRETFDVSFLLVSIAPYPPHMAKVLQELGIPFRILECKLRAREILRTVREIRRYCKEERVEVVHTHIFFASLVGLLGARLAGVPVRINTRHHASMNHGTSYYWLDRLTAALGNRIVATSEMLARVLAREKASPREVKLIHLGIDTQRFREVPEEAVRALAARYNPSGAAPVIGVIARHIELKGIQYVIPAFQRLLERYPNAYLILGYATGPYHGKLQELLAPIPPDRYIQIEFELDVFALYRLFDVFVHVPIGEEEESFGLTFLEALASGVPSVFTLSGVGPELLEHRRNAWIVDYRDSDQVYEGIVTLLEDPALRASLSQAGRETIDERFSHRRMVRRLEGLYRESFRELSGGGS